MREVAVQPVSVDEILAVLRFAGRNAIPVTVRGAGTGNYGQCGTCGRRSR